MKPFIIEQGRGRLILNQMRDQGSITIDIDGTGVTRFLSPKDLRRAAAVMLVMAERLDPKA